MSEEAVLSAHRLRATLARIAADGVAVQPSEATSTDEALAFFVDEISLCRIGRQLSFSFNEGPAVRVDASGGRLLRIVAADGMADPMGLIGQPLSGRNDGQVDAVVDLLQRGFSGRSCIGVDRAPLEQSAEPSKSGIASDRLRQAVGISEPDALHPFDAVSEGILAEYTVDHGWIVALSEDAKVDAHLSFLQPYIADHARFADALPEDAVLCLDLGDGVSACLMWSDAGPDCLIVDKVAMAQIERVATGFR